VLEIPEKSHGYADWAYRRANRLSILDIDLHAFLGALLDEAETITMALPSVGDGYRPEALAGVVSDELRAIQAHDAWADIVGASFLAGHLGVTVPASTELSLDCRRTDDGRITISGPPASVRGVAPTLRVLAGLYEMVFARLKAAQEEYGPGITVVTEWARTYPRRLQARFLSMGAREADPGLVPAFLVDDVTFVPVISPIHNLDAMSDLSPAWLDWAAAACDSGLVRIRADDLPDGLQPDGARLTRLMELSMANAPIVKRRGPPEPSRGCLVDRHYQALFVDSVIDNVTALYGPNEQFRDTAWTGKIETTDVLRVKHWTVPVFEASSLDEVESIVDAVTSCDDDAMYFRGQTRQYYLERQDFVRELLYGTRHVSEPSLPGAAARRVLSYDIAHPALQCLLQDLAYRLAVEKGRSIAATHEAWLEATTSAAASWDLGVMALAQHYGIPTDGIDITRELDIACWFATNRFVAGPDGAAHYAPLEAQDWSEWPDEWPAVFVIRPATPDLQSSVWHVEELHEIGLNGLRPERQQAAFFMGATGIHQNRLAEALACVIRLRPGVYRTPYEYEFLFPGEDEDRIYRFMLECRERQLGSLTPYLKEIPIYTR
jgi:hypothetical protein